MQFNHPRIRLGNVPWAPYTIHIFFDQIFPDNKKKFRGVRSLLGCCVRRFTRRHWHAPSRQFGRLSGPSPTSLAAFLITSYMNSSMSSTVFSAITNFISTVYTVLLEPFLCICYVWLMWGIILRSHLNELHSSFYKFFIYTGELEFRF